MTREIPSESATPWFAPTRPDELSRWAGWVRAMVRHFGTTVSFYEIWNEENTQQFWTQGPDPVAYAAPLACSDVAAKSVDPKATIVSGGLSTNDIGYLQHLMAKLASYPDASSFGELFRRARGAPLQRRTVPGGEPGSVDEPR